MTEPPRTALGISNREPNGRTARCGPHILDPYGRGACDVCPGLLSLKVVGPIRFGLLTPRSPGAWCEVESGGVPLSTSGAAMKKWHFPILFIVIVAAVAIGINFGTLYDSAMLSMTGDCRYWRASGTESLLNSEARKRMSTQELTCALEAFAAEMERQNDAK